MKRALLGLWFLAIGCDSTGRTLVDGGATKHDLASVTSTNDGGTTTIPDGSSGCTGGSCYTVYAHSDTDLYSIDLNAKTLVHVGGFNAPDVKVGSNMEPDTITDLAVATDDTIYVISNTNLYTASPTDGHVTLVGAVTACGSKAVALSFTKDGTLYAGDYKGALCTIDLSHSPPTVTQVATLSSGLALAGDLVAIDDGTVFGTVYKLSDSSHMGTQSNNLLAKIDVTNGTTTALGSTGYPELFGTAYQLGKVFGFTHDGSGDVVTIDPATGVGTLFNTFMDPSTNKGIAFAGAGVNAMVPSTIQ